VCIPTHTFQRIGVDLTGDQILTRFRDQNGDDPFEWFVEYSVALNAAARPGEAT
jgi:hypothetical protein